MSFPADSGRSVAKPALIFYLFLLFLPHYTTQSPGHTCFLQVTSWLSGDCPFLQNTKKLFPRLIAHSLFSTFCLKCLWPIFPQNTVGRRNNVIIIIFHSSLLLFQLLWKKRSHPYHQAWILKWCVTMHRFCLLGNICQYLKTFLVFTTGAPTTGI